MKIYRPLLQNQLLLQSSAPHAAPSAGNAGTVVPYAFLRSLRRASFTVETALLMPLILLTVFMTLYLGAHIHNRTWLFASAAEQAVSGHEQEEPSLFAAGEIKVTRSDDTNSRTIEMSSGTFHYSGKILWTIEEKASYKKFHPVKLIRLSHH